MRPQRVPVLGMDGATPIKENALRMICHIKGHKPIFHLYEVADRCLDRCFRCEANLVWVGGVCKELVV